MQSNRAQWCPCGHQCGRVSALSTHACLPRVVLQESQIQQLKEQLSSVRVAAAAAAERERERAAAQVSRPISNQCPLVMALIRHRECLIAH